MSRKWYGNLQNRLEENQQFCKEITVGTGMTEYSYSDREAYEVIEVRDQKHVTVRRLDHKHIGDGCMDNQWELISNPENPEYDMTKRGNYWYFTRVFTLEELEAAEANERDPLAMLNFVMAGADPEKIRKNGKQVKYTRANVSFGVADYYYDYEF